MEPSKEILNKGKSVAGLRAADDEHGAAYERDLNELMGDDTGTLARELVGRMVARTVRCFGIAEEKATAHALEIAGHAPVFAGRDRAAADMVGELVDARGGIEMSYGPHVVRQVGYEGQTPRRPDAVHQLAGRFVEAAATITLPPPRRPELVYDLQGAATRIGAKRAQLGELLEAVSRERREAETTLVAKDEALDDFDAVFSATADTLSNFLALSGNKELARRVRPSPRRPGLTVEVEEAIAEENAAEDAA